MHEFDFHNRPNEFTPNVGVSRVSSPVVFQDFPPSNGLPQLYFSVLYIIAPEDEIIELRERLWNRKRIN